MTTAGRGPAGHDLRHVPQEQAACAARQGSGPVRVRPRVVIVGAGFAGLNAARALRRAGAQVTIVDGHGYHTFQPLLYQVSTGYPWRRKKSATRSA